MQKKTIKLGVNLITAAISLLILASFFHEQLAAALSLSNAVELRLVYLGLFWGGAAGCAGIVIAAIGVLRSERNLEQVSIARSLLVLGAVIILFFFLLYSAIQAPAQKKLHPGETIII